MTYTDSIGTPMIDERSRSSAPILDACISGRPLAWADITDYVCAEAIGQKPGKGLEDSSPVSNRFSPPPLSPPV